MLTNFVKLQIVLSRRKYSQLEIKMMLPDLIFEHVRTKAELDKLEIIHQLLILTDILHNIILVLVDLQIVDNMVQILQFIHSVCVQFLPVESA